MTANGTPDDTLLCPHCGAELVAEPWRGSHLMLGACCGRLVHINPGKGFLAVDEAELLKVNERLVEAGGDLAHRRLRL